MLSEGCLGDPAVFFRAKALARTLGWPHLGACSLHEQRDINAPRTQSSAGEIRTGGADTHEAGTASIGAAPAVPLRREALVSDLAQRSNRELGSMSPRRPHELDLLRDYVRHSRRYGSDRAAFTGHVNKLACAPFLAWPSLRQRLYRSLSQDVLHRYLLARLLEDAADCSLESSSKDGDGDVDMDGDGDASSVEGKRPMGLDREGNPVVPRETKSSKEKGEHRAKVFLSGRGLYDAMQACVVQMGMTVSR